MNKIDDAEYLEVRWNEPKEYGYSFKRFKRMGALLEWVEQHPNKMVVLVVYRKKDGE